MLNDLKKFFIYNKSERRGIFILMILILFVLLINLSLPYLIENPAGNNPALIARLDSFLLQESLKDSLLSAKEETDSIVYFQFDPNGLPAEKWKNLGLSIKQIRVIKNYEKAGGKFYRKEDLKKIYSISEEMYDRLEPYIAIEKNFTHKTKENTKAISNKKKAPGIKKDTSMRDQKKPAKKQIMIELNTADSGQLLHLYGIGPVFASRIIKYCELIGGYFSTDQLLEVYGFDSIRLDGIIDQIHVDTTKIKKVRVNYHEFEEILRHPYFSYELTREIFQHREMGLIQNLDEFRNFKTVNDSLFQKIIPYLSLE